MNYNSFFTSKFILLIKKDVKRENSGCLANSEGSLKSRTHLVMKSIIGGYSLTPRALPGGTEQQHSRAPPKKVARSFGPLKPHFLKIYFRKAYQLPP